MWHNNTVFHNGLKGNGGWGESSFIKIFWLKMDSVFT